MFDLYGFCVAGMIFCRIQRMDNCVITEILVALLFADGSVFEGDFYVTFVLIVCDGHL